MLMHISYLRLAVKSRVAKKHSEINEKHSDCSSRTDNEANKCVSFYWPSLTNKKTGDSIDSYIDFIFLLLCLIFFLNIHQYELRNVEIVKIVYWYLYLIIFSYRLFINTTSSKLIWWIRKLNKSRWCFAY